MAVHFSAVQHETKKTHWPCVTLVNMCTVYLNRMVLGILLKTMHFQ